MLGNLWIDQFAAMRSEPCESDGFILAHEAAVAGDIGGEDGREPSFDPLSAQSLPPLEARCGSLLPWRSPINAHSLV